MIEMLIMLMVLGTLVAMAIPRYMEISTNANIAVTKGLLTNIRSAISYRYMASKMSGGPGEWPKLDDIQDNANNTGSSIMMDGNLPNNPFSTGERRDIVREVSGQPNPRDTRGGWAYDPKTGHFWADTNSGNDEVNF